MAKHSPGKTWLRLTVKAIVWRYERRGAHDEIYDALKKINTEAKIKTQWTYLEDLPYEEYGDEID